jgi:fucose 4-O-acetylase-like acetyltransferase
MYSSSGGYFLAPPRRLDIDRAKGLAILLVVFGHLVARADPAGVTWYEPLRRAVYAFHMPFFLYLSGLAAALSGGVLIERHLWAAWLRARASRLLVPFFGLGVLIVLGKCAAGHFLFVDNAPAGLGPGLAALVWHTASSPALSIWYLAVLFALSALTPMLLGGQKARLPALCVAALLLYPLPLPAYLYLDHIGRYAIFFVIGAWAGTAGASWTRFVDRAWPVCLAAFLTALALIARFGAHWPASFILLPIGTMSMPALHGLVRHYAASSRSLLWLGRYCFMIYLFNTIFIGLAKGLLLTVWSWRAPDFLPLAAALMLSGTLGPVALKRCAFSRGGRLDRLTD